jgi:hypothetical protein
MPRRSKKASQPTVDAVVDEDLVKPTQYHHAANLTELPSIYKDISSKPDFEPLKLEPIDNPGPKLLENVDSSNLESVFRLLWDDSIIDYLVYYTNACALRTKARPSGAAAKAAAVKAAATDAAADGDDESDNVAVVQRDWIPVTIYDILAYIGVVM